MYLAVIPGNLELDPKALAKLTGDRNIEMVPLKDVQSVTGYIRGGVTVLGCKKAYPVYVDETAQLFDVISVSAGVRGTQILLKPDDYIRATNPVLGAISRESITEPRPPDRPIMRSSKRLSLVPGSRIPSVDSPN